MIFSIVAIYWSCSPNVSKQATAISGSSAGSVNEPTPVVIERNIPGTDVSFQMALIPGGQYFMGSSELELNREGDEGPQVNVKLDSFWIGVHEVRFEEYQVFREKELDRPPEGKGSTWNADAISRPSPPYEDPTFGMGNRGFPAVSMTQFAALQYCKWLSDKSGKFYRLPTEAEWEYACRAGTTATFHFGNESGLAEDYAWHSGNSEESYHRIGTKKPNPWGLYDTHGNVSEWTMDQYDAKFYQKLADQSDVHNNPWAKPASLHPRTVRGGSWADPLVHHRCAARIKSSLKWKERDPQIPKSFWWNTDSPFVGFRLMSPKTQPSPAEIKAFWALVLGG